MKLDLTADGFTWPIRCAHCGTDVFTNVEDTTPADPRMTPVHKIIQCVSGHWSIPWAPDEALVRRD
jgi:hypothetical protein